jgi:site-specific DNA recombinase
MYELFRVERRIKTTADRLNAKGYRTRNGSPFSDNTVNRLLRDPMAKGLRRTNYTKSPGKNKQWQYKPSEEWVMQECPAIVSAELWDDCNRILDEQERKPVKAGRKVQHLLSGYVTCTCGNRMYIRHTSNNYACQSCKTRINEIDLDEIFHGQLHGRIASLDPDAYRAELAQTLAEKETLHARTTAERAKLAKRKTELVNLHLDGELDKTLFREEYKPIETRILQLDAELPALEASIAFSRVQSTSAEAALLDAQSLTDHWTDMPFTEKRAIVETILEGIVIGTDSIAISFAYNPTVSGNPGNTPRNFRGS